LIRLVLNILVLVFFIGRDALCYYFFPEMKTVTGEWDGSNDLTMNIYSGVIFICFVNQFLTLKYFVTYFFSLTVLWFSIFDVADRCLGIYEFTGMDKVFTIPASLILGSITYYFYAAYLREKTINN
jgi:hypothetical protein